MSSAKGPLFWLLVLLLASAALAAVVVSAVAPGLETFASYGLAKTLATPVSLLVLIVFVVRQRRGQNSLKMPLFAQSIALLSGTLVVLTVVGILTAVLRNQDLSVKALVQDAALFLLPVIALVAGGNAVRLSQQATVHREVLVDLRRFARVVIYVAIICRLVGVELALIAGVAVGACVVLLVLPGTLRHRIPAWILLGVLVVAPGGGHSGIGGGQTSSSTLVQVAAALLLVLVVKMRGALRIPTAIAVLVIVAGSCYVWFYTDAGRVMHAAYVGEDVTLLQRQYEAQVVVANTQGPASKLIGLGLGSTVDLINSPDASTLEGSGRQLEAVHSVHLLPAFLRLKFGLAGDAWLVTLGLFILVLLSRAIEQRDKAVALLLTFSALNLLDALPAATNLLTDLSSWTLLGAALQLKASRTPHLPDAAVGVVDGKNRDR